MPSIQPTPNGIRKLVSLDSARNDAAAALTSNNDVVVAVFPTQQQRSAATTVSNQNDNDSPQEKIHPCVFYDGKDSLHGWLMGSNFTTVHNNHKKQQPSSSSQQQTRSRPFVLNNTQKPFLLRVESAIVSKSALKDFCVFVTSGVVVQTHGVKRPSTLRPFAVLPTPPENSSDNKAACSSSSSSSVRIPGGVAPHFFQQWAPKLGSQALAGGAKQTPASLLPNNTNTLVQQQASALSKFLSHHKAIRTLHHTSTSTVSAAAAPLSYNAAANNNSSNTNTQYQYYMSALREFQTQQLDRQKASLTSNSGREDAKKAPLVESQYLKALNMALTGGNATSTQQQPAPRLSRPTLLFWHSLLCGGGVHAEAGRLRTKGVRVGPVNFRSHTQVPADLDSVCASLSALEERLLVSHNNHSHNQTEDVGLRAATFAAAVFFGLVDVHGFTDGNGRLSRIALNWALHKAGFPFSIHLFATPAQRKEYTDAIRQTRRNLSLTFSRVVPTTSSSNQVNENNAMVRALQVCGALGPLVELILDRISKAMIEFEKLVQEKLRGATEEREAKAAKAVRDRERAGTCLICFEDNPNIATLCCGKAVHLNCVAQWLSSNATCPNCRESFPALPPRLQAPTQAAAGRPAEAANALLNYLIEGGEDDTTMDSDESSTYGSTTTTTTTDAAEDAGNDAVPDPSANDTTTTSDSEEDDTTTVDVDVLPRVARVQIHDVDEDETTTVEMELEQPQPHPHGNNNHDETSSTTSEMDDNADDDDDDTTTVDTLPVAYAPPQAASDTSTTATDGSDTETTAVDADTSSTTGQGDSEDDDDDTSTVVARNSSNNARNDAPAYCSIGNCYNRPARDCTNHGCGRCCLLHGRFACDRHGTGYDN